MRRAKGVLMNELTVKENFKPSLSLKYPLFPGQLIGVLEVLVDAEFTDFRGQEVAAGAYTLRYGQQPVDGNHIGTSELSDFLLAIPASFDEDPATTQSLPTLFKQSAKSTGSNHPAIYSLLPSKANETTPSIIRDKGKDLLILNLSTTAKSGELRKPIPFRMVIVGHSE